MNILEWYGIVIAGVIVISILVGLFGDQSKPSDDEIAAQMLIMMMWEDEYPEDY